MRLRGGSALMELQRTVPAYLVRAQLPARKPHELPGIYVVSDYVWGRWGNI